MDRRKAMTRKGRQDFARITLTAENTGFLRQCIRSLTASRWLKCMVYAELMRRRKGVR